MIDDLISGTAGSVVVGGTVVGEMAEWSLDLTHSPVEITAFGDVWMQYIPSLRGATGSFSGNFDSADAGQNILETAIKNGTEVSIGLWMDATTRFETRALLTGVGDGVTVDGADTALWDFTATRGMAFELPRLWLLEDGAAALWENGDFAYLTL
jgi:hypothetical protein